MEDDSGYKKLLKDPKWFEELLALMSSENDE